MDNYPIQIRRLSDGELFICVDKENGIYYNQKIREDYPNSLPQSYPYSSFFCSKTRMFEDIWVKITREESTKNLPLSLPPTLEERITALEKTVAKLVGKITNW